MDKETIYVVGHKSPDTDSVCSAVVYAAYLKKVKRIDAVAAAAGQLNPETKFVLDHFKAKEPLLLGSVKGKTLILMDHNEKSQSPDGIENARILEVLDHHKIAFEWAEPIKFYAEPVGATATLVAKIALADKRFKLDKTLSGLLLSAILSDTVVFKSPTATKTDIENAKILAKFASIKNLRKFGIEVKKQKASLKGMSADQIIYSDFKEFETNGKKFAVGQVELVDLSEANERKNEILAQMDKIRAEKQYEFIALMETDIISEGTELLVAGNPVIVEKAFSKKIQNSSVYLKGMLSRKKGFLPPLMEMLK